MDVFTSPQVLTLVPLTVGLVQAIKATGFPDRFAPLASLLIGIGLAFFVLPTIQTVILGGIIVGLSASGLYSGARAMTGS